MWLKVLGKMFLIIPRHVLLVAEGVSTNVVAVVKMFVQDAVIIALLAAIQHVKLIVALDVDKLVAAIVRVIALAIVIILVLMDVLPIVLQDVMEQH